MMYLFASFSGRSTRSLHACPASGTVGLLRMMRILRHEKRAINAETGVGLDRTTDFEFSTRWLDLQTLASSVRPNFCTLVIPPIFKAGAYGLAQCVTLENISNTLRRIVQRSVTNCR